MTKKSFRLSDNSIAQIARILQVAIITGTDITDQLRMFYLEEKEEGLLDPLDEYVEIFEGQIEKYLEELASVNGTLDTSEAHSFMNFDTDGVEN